MGSQSVINCPTVILQLVLKEPGQGRPTDTMHAIQGAMAVRRERRKRDDRRRMSGGRNGAEAEHKGREPAAAAAGATATATGADLSAGPPPDMPLKVTLKGGQSEEGRAAATPAAAAADGSSSSVTAFHLGVVFILIAFLLLFSGLISRSRSERALDSDWSTLIGVGIALLLIGLFMVMVNRILTEREEEELAKYVHHRLARTRSGHALALRETESGEEDILAAHLQQHRHRHRHLSSGDFWNGPGIGRRGSTRSVSAAGAPTVVLNGKVLPAVTITREAAPPPSPGGMRRHGGSRASLREYNGGRRPSRAAEECERLLPREREEAKRRLSNPNVLPSSSASASRSSPRRASKRRKSSAAPIIVCSPPSPSISPSPSGIKS